MITKDEGPWAKWWEPQIAKGERKGPAARLARLLRPYVRPKQLWIDERNARGYDAEDFEAEGVAVYLEKDVRDTRDARSGSSIGAGPSNPSDPNVSSEGAREDKVPILGDEGYLDLLEAAFPAGHLTEQERRETRRVHLAVAGARGAA